jgi:hypothetical protein
MNNAVNWLATQCLTPKAVRHSGPVLRLSLPVLCAAEAVTILRPPWRCLGGGLLVYSSQSLGYCRLPPCPKTIRAFNLTLNKLSGLPAVLKVRTR